MLYALDRVIVDRRTPRRGAARGGVRAAVAVQQLPAGLHDLCAAGLGRGEMEGVDTAHAGYALDRRCAQHRRHVRRSSGRITRSTRRTASRVTSDVVTQYNAGWRDYLVTGGRLHFAWWSHVFYEGRTALFPGVTAIVLAAIAMVTGRAIRDPRARMALAIGVLGVACLGTSLPGYACCTRRCRSLSGLRNVARWGWLALAAVAMLAGFGVAALENAGAATTMDRAWRSGAGDDRSDSHAGRLHALQRHPAVLRSARRRSDR